MRRGWENWACLALRSDCCLQIVGAGKEDGAKLFSEAHGSRTRGNKRCKLELRKFHLSVRKSFLLRRWSSTGTQSQRVCGLSIPGDIQAWQDKALRNLVWLGLLWAGGWTRWAPCLSASMRPFRNVSSTVIAQNAQMLLVTVNILYAKEPKQHLQSPTSAPFSCLLVL